MGALLLFCLVACEKDDKPRKESFPEFATIFIDSIGHLEATFFAGVIEAGDAQVTDKGICWDTLVNPVMGDYSLSKGAGTGTFNGTIVNLSPGCTYYVRTYATNQWGTAYGEQAHFSTLEVEIPKVNITKAEEISGTTIVIHAEITDKGGAEITERGFYLSGTQNPGEGDIRILVETGDENYSYTFEGLEPSEAYYIRAFATNEAGTAYGSVFNFQARIGNISYVLHRSNDPTQKEKSAYEKIETAMDSALWYYNRYANLSKKLNIYYNPDVPTADGNINGTIRFGKEQYMNKVTAMHEVAHTLGVGTSGNWKSLLVDGKWTGSDANQVLREITGDDSAVLKGDRMHFWPYGLNYYSEYESKADLINHCMIVGAMKKDGL